MRVRFQLRKECVFGEHFFILGEHPVFGGGLWDPENALPLNWSDGHVWTLDLVCILLALLRHILSMRRLYSDDDGGLFFYNSGSACWKIG